MTNPTTLMAECDLSKAIYTATDISHHISTRYYIVSSRMNLKNKRPTSKPSCSNEALLMDSSYNSWPKRPSSCFETRISRITSSLNSGCPWKEMKLPRWYIPCTAQRGVEPRFSTPGGHEATISWCENWRFYTMID